jgi:hypothetical protein
MKIRLAELEKMLETEKEARNELESMKSNLEGLLDANNNPSKNHFVGQQKVNASKTNALFY